MSREKPVSRSGRFSSGPNEDVVQFTESVSYDRRLWRQDIMGSLAHAEALHAAGILTAEEESEIRRHLEAIGSEIAAGQFSWDVALEDVHMNIESELTKRTPAGAKLHTGRSRNDQIAVDMRMWLRDEIVEMTEEITELQASLVDLSQRSEKIPLPGYTHLQRAQPVYAPHHLLAYVEMLERDRDRLRDAFQRMNVCPLGSGALAGSPLGVDRELIARRLGFVARDGSPRVSQNSMDSISDRDFVVEFLSAGSVLAIHLSRLSEDIILWNSSEFGFIELSDEFTTGSSLMPQKKNPDIAELTRGKSGRVVGALVGLLVTLKGLPMTYNRDLQEDKEGLFDSVDTLRAALRLNAGMLRSARFNEANCRRAVGDPLLLATDLADYLVKKGVPFRDAHHVVGSLVAMAEDAGKPISELPLATFQSASAAFEADVFDRFDVAASIAGRNGIGGPSLDRIRERLQYWEARFEERRAQLQ